MNYYKLINNNTIFGVVTENAFIKYSSAVDSYIHATDLEGEYVGYKSNLYRDRWMQPVLLVERFELATIIKISEEEYALLRKAFEVNDEIIIEPDDEPELPIIPNLPENPDITVEFIRSSKLNEMSYACRTTIEKGFDLWILDNKYHHFSLTTLDQLNLMSISTQLETAELIPYHADGEASLFYTVEEIKQIIAAATLFKNYHTAYYNALKNYINSLETIEDIAAITYGIKIPDEYQTEVLKTIELEMTNYESH